MALSTPPPDRILARNVAPSDRLLTVPRPLASVMADSTWRAGEGVEVESSASVLGLEQHTRTTLCGMPRVRISTTVDGQQLATVRVMLGAPDSKILDRALKALIDQVEGAQELEALAARPYEDDPELSWAPPPGGDLPYDGEVPADVVRMAAQRRSRQ